MAFTFNLVKVNQANVQVQAALYLKNLVCNAWNTGVQHQTPSFGDKENVNIGNQNQFSHMLSMQDRQFLMANIISALDMVVHMAEDPTFKVIVSSIENIIWNISQCDYGEWIK